jgi:hypothetical protein
MLFLFLWLTSVSFGGAWVKAPGEGYTKAGYRFFTSQDGFVQGEASGLVYQAHSATLYTEWGLPGGFQVIADLPFVSATQRSPAGIQYHHRWTGDLRLELDRKILDNGLGTLGVDVRIPTYKRASSYSGTAQYDRSALILIADRFPELGDLCVDVTVKWMMGYGANRGWITGGVGPRFRSLYYTHQVWGTLSGGVWLHPSMFALGLYTEGAVSLPLGDGFYSSREWLYTQMQAMVTGFQGAPGLAFEVGVGVIPVAVHASRGLDVSVGVSWNRRRTGVKRAD